MTRDLARKPASGVAHFFSRMNRAGAELRTVEVVDQTGFAFDFYAISGEKGELDNHLRESGHRVIHVKMALVGLVRIAKLLRQARYRVVHCHLGVASGPIIMVAAIVGVPVRVAHFRSDGVGGQGGQIKRVAIALSRVLIAKFATDLIGVAPSALDRGWNADWRRDPRCSVIANGIDANALRRLSAPTRLSRPEPESEIIVSNIGRIEPSKNRGRAIRIWQELASKRASTLYLVGEVNAQDREQIAETSAAIDFASRIVEVGDTDDVAAILGKSHVVIMTSTREGLPGVVLESLAVGVPVVGTDLPGVEWIASQVWGVTAMSLEASNTEWADAIWSASASPSLAIMDSFDEGPFLLEKSARQFESLWSLGLGRTLP